MGFVRLKNYIAASSHPWLRQFGDAGASLAAFPRWSVGTINVANIFEIRGCSH
jgi:hypothetical protein